jgi:hypothetical protein
MMDERNDGNSDGDFPQKKKAYTKPTLIEVALKPDEAVLGNCKVSGTSGPGGSGNCKPVANCSSQGS